MIAGISGPSFTGKTTLTQLISKSLPLDAIVIPDFHEKVYRDLTESAVFSSFQEIHKDRDYLLVYIGKVVAYYKEMVEAYRDYQGLVLFDGTYLDILVYMMLSLWYHYPTQDLQENMVHELLSLKEDMKVIYMTSANDDTYPLEMTQRRYSTSFRKCRKTELYYYDIFRDLKNVVPLPSSSVSDCEYFVLKDLKERGLL